MSTNTNQLATVASAMQKLDEIACHASLSLGGINADSPFTEAIRTANAIQQIREILTDEMVEKSIMPLMNSRLGFRTDKDPNRPTWNRQTRRMEAPEPYPVSVVRECVIEATLRGVPVVGNCLNIIAGNSYITKEGFWYLLRHRVEDLTDFKLMIGVPKMVKPTSDAKTAGDEEAKGAIVTCSASWKIHGKEDRIEREIPIRLNAMMGTDAIMGKAERKILAAAYAQITGTQLGDADVTEDDIPGANAKDVTPKKGMAAQAEPLGASDGGLEDSPELDIRPSDDPENNEAPETMNGKEVLL